VPPGDPDTETAKLARETFPDIKDPRETVLAEAAQAPKLLAGAGLAAGLEYPADGARPAGDPLIGSAQDALSEWQHAVGPLAGTELSPAAPEMTARLLAPCLHTGPVAEMLEGAEARELIREYYRLRRRARALVRSAGVPATAASSDAHDPEPVLEAFLNWYAARHGDVPEDTADAVGTILYQWGPGPPPGERSRYASSPHRIEMTARLVRDGYLPDHANEALRLLPEWTQWCIEQSGPCPAPP
jgi:hypothetical protein